MPPLIYISMDLATDTKISNSERLTEVDLKAFIRKHPFLSQCDTVEVLDGANNGGGKRSAHSLVLRGIKQDKYQVRHWYRLDLDLFLPLGLGRCYQIRGDFGDDLTNIK